MQATVAVRHIGEVVIDVLSGARDPDGDAVVGQKSGAGDEMPLGADRRSGRRVRYRRVIRYRDGHGPLLSTYRTRAVADAAGVVNQRPTLDHFIRYHMPAMRKCRQQTSGPARRTPGVASGTPTHYFAFSC